MTDDLLYNDEFIEENNSEQLDDFEKQVLENLYKLKVMRKTLLKMLNDLNKTNISTTQFDYSEFEKDE